MFRYRIFLYRGSCIEVVRVFLCVVLCLRACVFVCVAVCMCARLCNIVFVFDLIGLYLIVVLCVFV